MKANCSEILLSGLNMKTAFDRHQVDQYQGLSAKNEETYCLSRNMGGS